MNQPYIIEESVTRSGDDQVVDLLTSDNRWVRVKDTEETFQLLQACDHTNWGETRRQLEPFIVFDKPGHVERRWDGAFKFIADGDDTTETSSTD